MNLYENELELYNQYKIIAGVDEAGRGPLAGPLFVSAVVLGKEGLKIEGVNDSKKLSEKKREYLYEIIKEKASYWSIVEISPQEIDKKNILRATMDGMTKAVKNLMIKPDICLIDGNRLPKDIAIFSKAIVKGDSKYASIAAASILAKVSRDRFMKKLHYQFPQYNFIKNKGYGTKEHIAAIRKYGITPWHRKSYKPISEPKLDFYYD
jgi:ribonuclease HII